MDWSLLQRFNATVMPAARLADFTTFRLGGPCPALLDCPDINTLQSIVAQLHQRNISFIVIGGGSNLLVADEGLDQVVIRYANATADIRCDGARLEVSGATTLDACAQFAVHNGWAGITFASGIPGTVGGAVAGNAGAFGQQIGDILEEALLLDFQGRMRWAPRDELGFAYRQSNIPSLPAIVAAVRLRLTAGDAAALQCERQEIMDLRRTKHPDWRTTPTAGSFFKNVEPTSAAGRRQSAGWFLEQAGARAMRVAGARPFEKHANIIVTDGPCRAADVAQLARHMAHAVEQRFQIRLTPEVRCLGFRF